MTHTRADDSFLRKVIATLLVALALETFGGIYYYGKLVDRVEQLEQKIVEVSEIRDDIYSIKNSLVRIETKLDTNITTSGILVKTVNKIQQEQAKRTSIVYDAAKHMNTPAIHHYEKAK